ncbi:MAG: hypothetical protein Q4A43_01285 [Coriobacteriia bacterium]|nr:hypothetical protein [Coriobacteriia bacterium]
MSKRSSKKKQQQNKSLKSFKSIGSSVIFGCSALMLISTALMFMAEENTYGIIFAVLTIVCIGVGVLLRKY